VHPELNVAPPVRAGQAYMLACGDRDFVACFANLISKLQAGCRCTNDQHTAALELIRISKVMGGQ
jgi:hypothetical protein